MRSISLSTVMSSKQFPSRCPSESLSMPHARHISSPLTTTPPTRSSFLRAEAALTQDGKPERPELEASLGHLHFAVRRDWPSLSHVKFIPHRSHHDLWGRLPTLSLEPRAMPKSRCMQHWTLLRVTARALQGPFTCIHVSSFCGCSRATRLFQRLLSKGIGTFFCRSRLFHDGREGGRGGGGEMPEILAHATCHPAPS